MQLAVRGRFWTTVSIFLVVAVGLINRLVPLSQEGYLDRRPSLGRDLVFSRSLGGVPFPLLIAAGLLVVGVVFWFLAPRRGPGSVILRLIGFLCIIAAWTPKVAIIVGMLPGFIVLGWIVSGMGSRTFRPNEGNPNVGTPEEYSGFWRDTVHATPEQHRKHVRWSFIACWLFAAVFLAMYLSGDLYTQFPDSFSNAEPTVLWAIAFFIAPVFLSALFELVRDSSGERGREILERESKGLADKP